MTASTYKVNDPEAPSLLASKFNESLPTAGQPLTDGVIITGSDRVAYLTISFSAAVSSILSVTRTVEATTRTESLNRGDSIPAGANHHETIMVVSGEIMNLVYGANGGTYRCYIGAVVQNG